MRSWQLISLCSAFIGAHLVTVCRHEASFSSLLPRLWPSSSSYSGHMCASTEINCRRRWSEYSVLHRGKSKYFLSCRKSVFYYSMRSQKLCSNITKIKLFLTMWCFKNDNGKILKIYAFCLAFLNGICVADGKWV